MTPGAVSFDALDDADRAEFRWAVSRYAAGSSKVTEPPWVVARLLRVTGHRVRHDPALAASVTAVHVDSRGEAWLIRAYLRDQGGALMLGHVLVEHFEHASREVTGDVLRDLPLATIRDAARRLVKLEPLFVEARVGVGAKPPTAAERRHVDRLAKAASKPLRHGRSGYPLAHYESLARAYLEYARQGETSRRIYDLLAEKQSAARGVPVAPDTIKSQLRVAAAKFGFLAGGRQGRRYAPGPHLTTKEDSNG